MTPWIFRTVIISLFLACGGLYVRSYSVCELVQRVNTTQDGLVFTRETWSLASGRGGVYFNQTRSIWTASNERQAAEQADKVGLVWKSTELANSGYAGDYFARSKQPMKYGFGHTKQDNAWGASTSTSNAYVFPWAAPTVFLGLLPVKLLLGCIFPRRRERKLVQSAEFADNEYLFAAHERLQTEPPSGPRPPAEEAPVPVYRLPNAPTSFEN